jgi:hypothetical protein
MSRPLTRKSPTKSEGFSWGRFPMGDTGVVSYRLFRRDHRGSLHMRRLDFNRTHTRADIARALKRARKALRDKVDEIDLEAMGVAA